MPKLRLFTPGPTSVPPELMLEMAMPLDHHRTAGFRAMLKDTTELLKYLFQTETGTPLTITGSGTAAMEGAIIGCCTPGKKALVCHSGKFGERWRDICKRFKIEHGEATLPYGQGFKASDVEAALKKDDSYGVVIMVHSETSTAAVSDVEEIAKVAKAHNCLILVDAITAVGTLPLKMDAWGLDVVVTGSQKALMLPPGIGLACIGPKAWEAIDKTEPITYYNSFKAYRKSLATFDTPYTPNNQLIRGLLKSLQMIKEEGLENVWKRSARLAAGTRAAATAMGIELYAADPADSVTALKVPNGVDEGKWRKDMRAKFGIHCAGGQGEMKGSVIRLNHMGYVDDVDMLGAIAAMEWTLADQGYKFEMGAGATAFMKVIRDAMA